MSITADPVNLLAELVAIDSVNPGLVPGAAGETAIVAMLRERLDRSDFFTRIVTPAGHPDRPSLLAWRHSATGPTILLNGHLDTVGVEQMWAPFEPRIDGHRMYGRGAADMKGGIAGLVVAAEQIARDAVGGVILALVADEEDASLGTRRRWPISPTPACGRSWRWSGSPPRSTGPSACADLPSSRSS